MVALEHACLRKISSLLFYFFSGERACFGKIEQEQLLGFFILRAFEQR
jgi:hypothetical protein